MLNKEDTMIIVMERNATKDDIQKVVQLLKEHDFKVLEHTGEIYTVINALGDKTALSAERVGSLAGVKEVKTIREPFRLASRDRKNEDTIVSFNNGVKIGGDNKPVFMVGPCSVDENFDGLLEVAYAAKDAGCEFLRGGAFKPRTSPYDFQGLEEDALKMMAKAREKTGLLLVTEVMDAQDLPMISDYVDLVQIGARNMQNFKLLKAIGKSNKPVLLKRGPSATIKEFLLAAEHILYNGNENVILCERGIRTFDDSYTRNTLDLSAIPIIKKLSHLPIIVDPSHATGQRYLIEPMSKAALISGANGLMIEVHYNPEIALSDGKQSLSTAMFKDMISRLMKLRNLIKYDNNTLSADVE